MDDVMTMHIAVYRTGGRAVSRLHALLCNEELAEWEYECVVDALCGPVVAAELIANLAVCCQYLQEQRKQLEQQQREQGQREPQHVGGAGSGSKPQAIAFGATSFAEVAVTPVHELVDIPGGDLGRATRLKSYVTKWENAKGTQGTQGAVATMSSLLNMLSVAGEEGRFNCNLATAIHSLLLLEALVLVGWQREQQGLPVDEKFMNESVMPIVLLLRNSFEDATRDEREALVEARGKLLLSVLQLLLRKVAAAGGGDGSGVGGEESPVQKGMLQSQRTVLKLVLEILTEAVDLSGQSKWVPNMDDDGAGSDSSSSSNSISSRQDSSSGASLGDSSRTGNGSSSSTSSGSALGVGRGCGEATATVGRACKDGKHDWESTSDEDEDDIIG